MKQILVVAPPGRLQEGLQVLLATLPDNDVVVVANTSAAQAQMAVRPAQLVIIASHYAEKTLAALVNDCPKTRFLLLVEHAQYKETVKSAGADAVLVEGTIAGQLLAVVQYLLTEASSNQLEVE